MLGLALSLAAPRPPIGGGGLPGYIYADSVNGNDSNPGTVGAPVQTLAHAVSILPVAGTLSLVTGSTWREQLNPNQSCSVVVSGNGAPPIIDAADVVSGTWTQPNVGTMPHVWSISWTRANGAPSGSDELMGLWVAGVRPSYFASSAANLEANGSVDAWWCDNLSAVTANLYIYASANPNSDGITREATKRDCCIGWGNTAYTVTVSGPLELKRAMGHDGMLDSTGALGTGTGLLLRDGETHHAVMGATNGGGLQNSIITEYDPQSISTGNPGIPVAFYRASSANFSAVVSNTLALFAGGSSRQVNSNPSFYNHSSAGATTSFTVTGCASRGMGLAAASSNLLTLTNGYCEDAYSLGVDQTQVSSIVTRLMYRDTAATANVGGVVGLRSSTASTVTTATDYAAAVQTGNCFRTDGAPTSATLLNCSLYTAAGGAVTGSGKPAVTYSVLWSDSSTAAIAAVTGYSGDYNVLWAGNGQLGNFNASIKTTLSAWQSATSQDAHSCTIVLTDQTTGNPNAFWLGVAQGRTSPADGDFRINPAARVYSGAGTAYVGTFPDGSTLITAAGAQTYYNWQTGASAAGPPPAAPVFPTTLAQMRGWIANPTSWTYYTAPASGGTYNLDFVNAVYQFNGVTRADWATLLSASSSTFARSTSAFYTDASGAMTSVSANVARIGTAGLLYEAAATNLEPHSQDKSGWFTNHANLADAAAVAPDGTTTAISVTEDGTTNQHEFGLGKSQTFVAGKRYAYSALIEPSARTWVQLSRNDASFGDGGSSAFFHLTGAGSVGTTTGTDIFGIIALAGGYYRIYGVTGVSTGPAGGAGANVFLSTNGSTTNYFGNSLGVYVWGVQWEEASANYLAPTSYIATAGAAASRGQDILTLQLGASTKTETVTFTDNSTQTLTLRDRASVVSNPLSGSNVKTLVAA